MIVNLTEEINREFECPGELAEHIDFLKDDLNNVIAELRDLVICTEPQKYCPSDKNPLEWIKDKYGALIRALEYLYPTIHILEKYFDDWVNSEDTTEEQSQVININE